MEKYENKLSLDINYHDEQILMDDIIQKYDYYEDNRSSQLSDNRLIKYAIYNSDIPKVNDGIAK